MKISKVPGSGRLAPKPVPPGKDKAAEGVFGSALKKAMKTSGTAKTASPEGIDPEKLRVIRERIESGFYESPEILSQTAEKIIYKGKSK